MERTRVIWLIRKLERLENLSTNVCRPKRLNLQHNAKFPIAQNRGQALGYNRVYSAYCYRALGDLWVTARASPWKYDKYTWVHSVSFKSDWSSSTYIPIETVVRLVPTCTVGWPFRMWTSQRSLGTREKNTSRSIRFKPLDYVRFCENIKHEIKCSSKIVYYNIRKCEMSLIKNYSRLIPVIYE